MSMPLRDARELGKFLAVFIFVVILPTAVFYSFALVFPRFLDLSYIFIVTMLVSQAALTYWYATSVFMPRYFKPRETAHNEPLPKTTFIIVAYLPNEHAVIEETVRNVLEKVVRPQEGIEVILVYNTPHMDPLELRLREMAYRWPELILANAYASRGKSENLNYAIDLASGKMIVLIDADHLVAPDCLGRAWRWLDEGYDVVQGRCKIRNGRKSIVSSLVEVEFEVIYGVQHPAKSIIFDSSVFGGSNGYWKAEVIRKVKFSKDMLTEDIDSSVRGALAGFRFVHDRSIVSTELAPVTFKGLWYQRKRWAQGWFQCSVKYQLDIWRSRYLNFAQKFLWTTLLSWRVFYDVASSMLFPVLFAFWLRVGSVVLPMDAYIAFALIFTLCNGPYQSLVALKDAAFPRPRIYQFLLYAFLAWPYTIFKSFVHFVGILDELTGEKGWVISKRQ